MFGDVKSRIWICSLVDDDNRTHRSIHTDVITPYKIKLHNYLGSPRHLSKHEVSISCICTLLLPWLWRVLRLLPGISGGGGEEIFSIPQ